MGLCNLFGSCFGHSCSADDAKDKYQVDQENATQQQNPNSGPDGEVESEIDEKDLLILQAPDPMIEWISGARKETVIIKWTVMDFLALCELKELLKIETCLFSIGRTLDMPTRWCFNLQRMKNENNIGLFLKRLKPVTFKEVLEAANKTNNQTTSAPSTPSSAPPPGRNDNNNNAIVPTVNYQVVPYPHFRRGGSVIIRRPSVSPSPRRPNEPNPNQAEADSDSVHVYYECVIKRSGHGDVWLHKRTCIPNFEVGQRLGFRKLFTMDDLTQDDQPLQEGAENSKSKVPILSSGNCLHLEIKFSIHLKTDERTRSEENLLDAMKLEKSERYQCQLLQEQLGSLLKSGENSDLILLMEDDDDKLIPVHKNILSSRCPVFAAMLQSGMKESRSGVVRIKDVSSATMEHILTYIYTGSVNPKLNWNSVQEVEDLIYAGDKYSLQGLRELCDKMLYMGVNNDNATELLYVAQTHGLNIAVKEISTFIKRNVNEIFSGQKKQN